MSEPLFNFGVVCIAQLFVILVHAWHKHKLPALPRILLIGLLSAIIPGPLADLLGEYLGLGTYVLGFGGFSLALNAVFMYSLFAANTLLMQNAHLLHFCSWTFVYVAAFEVTNIVFPIWIYSLPVPSIEYFVLAFGAPLGLALAFALAWHILFGYQFVLFGGESKQ